uniref:Uncharacterized protein n=1 Tax=uncultured marine virus TaxID=186617 RepID=A0A0F7L7X7_9VIRU|nr:hypothetical protein [uncultured marine virus]
MARVWRGTKQGGCPGGPALPGQAERQPSETTVNESARMTTTSPLGATTRTSSISASLSFPLSDQYPQTAESSVDVLIFATVVTSISISDITSPARTMAQPHRGICFSAERDSLRSVVLKSRAPRPPSTPCRQDSG